MNIKLSVDRYAMAMGIDCRAPRQKLASGILLVGPCERSRSETLPAHLGSVLGVATPGKWESRLGVNVHTSAECKTDISAVLTVTSGPDSHMMSKLESHETW